MSVFVQLLTKQSDIEKCNTFTPSSKDMYDCFLLQGVNTVVLRASASISVLYGIFQKAEESGLMPLEILFKTFGFNTILLTLFKE